MLALVATIAMLPLCHTSAPARFGLQVNVTQTGGAEELVNNILWERDHGVRLFHIARKWSEIDEPGGLDKLAKDLNDAASLGFQPALTIQTIDTVVKTVPPRFKDTRWDDPALHQAFLGMLDKLAQKLPKDLLLVSLGNEVDAWLGMHPDETEPYLALLRDGQMAVKKRSPGLKVGVTTTFEGLIKRRPLVERIHRGFGVCAMTYYPLGDGMNVLPVQDVPAHFEAMLAVAGSRPLYLQEAGYPASTFLHSSEKAQAEFVDAVWAETTRRPAQVIGTVFFLMIDLSPKLVDDLTRYYGFDSKPFREMLGTLGFKDADGKPREAWDRFVRHLKG